MSESLLDHEDETGEMDSWNAQSTSDNDEVADESTEESDDTAQVSQQAVSSASPSIPASVLESLEKIEQIQRTSYAPSQPSGFKKYLKADTLVLLGMFSLMLVFLVIMLYWVQTKADALNERKPRQDVVEMYRNRDTQEISLGEYKTASSVSGQKNTLNMLEYEPVLTVESNVNTLMGVDSKLTQNKFKIKQEVESVMRIADDHELEQPDLSTVRERMKNTVNEILGDDQVLEVNFSNFKRYHLPKKM